MLQAKEDDEKIIKYTGISQGKLNELKKEMALK